MPFCMCCGNEISETARFCDKCGEPTSVADDRSIRKMEFSGKVYKCPNCGEIIKSFDLNCPACGLELRGTREADSVKVLAQKLEDIESSREYEKPISLHARIYSDWISKTDKQKISLIKSFPIPNSKEDLLEFMILATSNINFQTYDPLYSGSKGEKALTNAWAFKAKQVYEKAKVSYSTDNVFNEIQTLYKNCSNEILMTKRKGEKRKVLITYGSFALLVVVYALMFGIIEFDEIKENARLDSIVDEIEVRLEAKEYKYALMLAENLVYRLEDNKQINKWKIEREYWIDKVIEEADLDGVILEHPKDLEGEFELDDQDINGGKDLQSDDNGETEGE